MDCKIYRGKDNIRSEQINSIRIVADIKTAELSKQYTRFRLEQGS
uniref:Uncharacterized protein n=1 Tax=Tetranychus urticae TaxID=32264 RepID=T1L501_TETUR